MTRQAEPKRLLFLFSDTGGGHRSAAEAVREAIADEFGARYAVDMVDIFKDYAPSPLNRVPAVYPFLVRWPRAWAWGYRLSDGRRRARLMFTGFWPYLRRQAHALVNEHRCEGVVSFHPFASHPVLRAFGQRPPPFITVVTDLVSTHATWFNPGSAYCLVPTPQAYQRALECGLHPSRLRMFGLPVSRRFLARTEEKAALRARLGWPPGIPMVLLIGGGEGMGRLKQTALSIDRSTLPVGIAIVAGRNDTLKAELSRIHWQVPVFIYGFFNEMPLLMQAADFLVTKAGPGTLNEAFISGLPIIVYDYLPGQEEGNASYVEGHGAGVWAADSEAVIATLNHWVHNPEVVERFTNASRDLARPEAGPKIARLIDSHLQGRI